jgi:hypothetical protein
MCTILSSVWESKRSQTVIKIDLCRYLMWKCRIQSLVIVVIFQIISYSNYNE